MARTSKEIITSAATRYGIDPDLATRIAHIETGGTFDPRAFNKVPACFSSFLQHGLSTVTGLLLSTLRPMLMQLCVFSWRTRKS